MVVISYNQNIQLLLDQAAHHQVVELAALSAVGELKMGGQD